MKPKKGGDKPLFVLRFFKWVLLSAAAAFVLAIGVISIANYTDEPVSHPAIPQPLRIPDPAQSTFPIPVSPIDFESLASKPATKP
ncbi:hypothetical protein [Rhizobium sp. RAF56]|uniref:hypothetical protein n=1 Tax=Rhizobium sp. RAF56 TaxID=3233062 RepID=UPI003F99DDD2